VRLPEVKRRWLNPGRNLLKTKNNCRIAKPLTITPALKTIALYNVKGGVGKSAAAVNLAYLSSSTSYSTLLWDLDSQGASTYCLHKKGIDLNIRDLVKGENISDYIIKTSYKNLFLIPSDFSLRHLDHYLIGQSKSKQKIRDALSTLRDKFDLIFLDCPPGISKLAENIFFSADYILVPVIPSKLSIRSYRQIMNFIDRKGFRSNIVIPFFSMVDLRRKIHKDSMLDMKKNISNICNNYIPYLSDIEKMSENRKPVSVSKPASGAALAYQKLWEEARIYMAIE
jgi:chromosome partitioning protein